LAIDKNDPLIKCKVERVPCNTHKEVFAHFALVNVDVCRAPQPDLSCSEFGEAMQAVFDQMAAIRYNQFLELGPCPESAPEPADASPRILSMGEQEELKGEEESLLPGPDATDLAPLPPSLGEEEGAGPREVEFIDSVQPALVETQDSVPEESQEAQPGVLDTSTPPEESCHTRNPVDCLQDKEQMPPSEQPSPVELHIEGPLPQTGQSEGSQTEDQEQGSAECPSEVPASLPSIAQAEPGTEPESCGLPQQHSAPPPPPQPVPRSRKTKTSKRALVQDVDLDLAWFEMPKEPRKRVRPAKFSAFVL
jgi:hypothetical protein